MLFHTFYDSTLPLQMPISTQRKLRLLVLLQKKYLYTCKNIVTKPNLEEFLSKLFEQYRIENYGKQYWICVATDRFFIIIIIIIIIIIYFPILFIFHVICFVTYWHIYLSIYSFTFCCVLMLLICCQYKKKICVVTVLAIMELLHYSMWTRLIQRCTEMILFLLMVRRKRKKETKTRRSI